jgi:hypothetical protein
MRALNFEYKAKDFNRINLHLIIISVTSIELVEQSVSLSHF